MNFDKFKKYLYSPISIIAIVCFLLGLFFISIPQDKTSQKSKTLGQKIEVTNTLTPEPSPTSFPKLIQKPNSYTTPQPSVSVNNQSENNSTILPTQTPTPTTNNNLFNVQVNKPDGNLSFSISFHDGANPCSVLNDSKNSGKINSVTILHYGAPLNSDYVKEINGFSDNWNFDLNGKQMPKGCSNYNLSSGDTVLWRYN